jgi:hypothetical protein
MKQKAFIFGSGGTAKMIMSNVEQKRDFFSQTAQGSM